jgi:hypothetical protein
VAVVVRKDVDVAMDFVVDSIKNSGTCIIKVLIKDLFILDF